MSKAGEIVAGASGLGLVPGAALFSATFALLCYGSSQKLLDQLNSVLVGLVVASFLVGSTPVAYAFKSSVDLHHPALLPHLTPGGCLSGGHWRRRCLGDKLCVFSTAL
jgi:hypothetical protein